MTALALLALMLLIAVVAIGATLIALRSDGARRVPARAYYSRRSENHSPSEAWTEEAR